MTRRLALALAFVGAATACVALTDAESVVRGSRSLGGESSSRIRQPSVLPGGLRPSTHIFEASSPVARLTGFRLSGPCAGIEASGADADSAAATRRALKVRPQNDDSRGFSVPHREERKSGAVSGPSERLHRDEAW